MSWPQYYFNKSDHFLCGLLLCVHFSISSNQLGGRVACALKTRKKTKKKNKKKELTCLSFNVQCGIGGKKSYPWYRNTPWGKFVIYTAHHSFNVRQSTRQSTAIRDCPWVTATETSPPPHRDWAVTQLLTCTPIRQIHISWAMVNTLLSPMPI